MFFPLHKKIPMKKKIQKISLPTFRGLLFLVGKIAHALEGKSEAVSTTLVCVQQQHIVNIYYQQPIVPTYRAACLAII